MSESDYLKLAPLVDSLRKRVDELQRENESLRAALRRARGGE